MRVSKAAKIYPRFIDRGAVFPHLISSRRAFARLRLIVENLVVQDNVQQRTMNLQPALAIVKKA